MLSGAVRVFNEQGYDATSVAALTERLGLSKAALYHHFDSKEQVLDASLERALGPLEAVLVTPEATTGTAISRLAAVLRGAVHVLVAELPHVTLLLRVRGNSEVERRALDRRRSFDQRIAGLVRDAQREGSVRSDIEASVAARLLFGTVNSIVEWYRPGGPETADRLADDVVAVALDGLRTPDAEA
ncbi:TetR/AcrR family transcriptional regulator [Microbacterium mangrovi]|nr:TetR/AcrR family transcriptional regulator [Microbacterium mangrovi]